MVGNSRTGTDSHIALAAFIATGQFLSKRLNFNTLLGHFFKTTISQYLIDNFDSEKADQMSITYQIPTYIAGFKATGQFLLEHLIFLNTPFSLAVCSFSESN